ncbi:MAG: ribosomal protein S18-alanine N-acetyltransferase [Thermodesulfobacteriota bacterium]|nr:ribosomal protein S18-alanine N-acetyltransferase [Thermodesulfobacteriota bacterium]
MICEMMKGSVPDEENVSFVIVPLDNECYLEEIIAIEHLSFSIPWTRGMFVYEIYNQFSKLFVARLGNGCMYQIVGYVCVWIVVDEVQIANIAVHPKYRSLGVGKMLLSYALTYGKSLGCSMAVLEVRISNSVAKNLYQKCGFEMVGQRKGYYREDGEDAIVMSKRLH